MRKCLLLGTGWLTGRESSEIVGIKTNTTPFFEPFIIPITIAILVALFLLQRSGTDDDFAERFQTKEVVRVPGMAIYMNSDLDCTPPALIHNLQHNKVVHERVILLSIKTKEIPYVPPAERIEVYPLDNAFYRVVLHYGFMEDPDVPRDLALARQSGLAIELDKVSYFLGRERLLPTHRPGMSIWREQLFALMSRNARDAADFFRLPPEQVVELGIRVEM